MDVAVAGMAIGQRQPSLMILRHEAAGLVDEGRDVRDPHRKIGAHMVAALGLALDQPFADGPEGFCLGAAFGKHGINDLAAFHGLGEEIDQQGAQVDGRTGRQFDQHMNGSLDRRHHVRVDQARQRMHSEPMISKADIRSAEARRACRNSAIAASNEARPR